MSTTNSTLLASLMALGVAATGTAQTATATVVDPPARRPRPPLEAVLDADGNGTIDAEEIAGAIAALMSLDTDRDGHLSRDEYRPPRRERSGGGPDGSAVAGSDGGAPSSSGPDIGTASAGPAKGQPVAEPARPRPPEQPVIVALDVNGDRFIDARELAGASMSLQSLDRNHDGALSPDEYRPPRPERPSPRR